MPIPLIGAALGGLSSGAGAAASAATSALGGLTKSIEGAAGKVKSSLGGMADAANKAADAAGGAGQEITRASGLMDALGRVTNSLKSTLGGLLAGVTAVVDAIASVIEIGLKPLELVARLLAVPLKMLAAIINAVTEPFRVMFGLIERLVDVPLKMLDAGLKALGTPMRIAGAVLLEFVKRIERAIEIFSAPFEQIENTMGAGTKVLDAAFDSVQKAITNPLEGVPELLGQIQKYVSIFDPAIVDAFNFAMEELMATIGRALVPVFEAVIPVVRQFTRTLAPVLDQLAPVIAQLAQAIGGELIKLLPTLQTALVALVPLVKSYAEQMVNTLRDQAAMLVALNAAQTAFSSVVDVLKLAGKGVLEALKTIFSPILKVFSPITDMFSGIASSGLSLRQNLSRLAIAVSAVVAKISSILSGDASIFQEFKDRTLGDLGPLKKGDPALAAAQNPQTMAVEQLGKRAMEQAFIAANRRQGDADKPPDERSAEFLATIAGDVKSIGDFSMENIENAVKNGVLNAMKQVIPSGDGATGFLGPAVGAAARRFGEL